MKTTVVSVAVAVVVVVALAAVAVSAEEKQTYNVGVAVVDLTPTQQQLDNRDIFLGGYGIWKVRGPATGVHDPTYARAWVVDDGNTTLAFVSHDSIGNSNRIIRHIRREIERLIGIPYANVHISSTHTHSGPDTQGLWGGITPDYNETYIEGTIKSIVDAYNSRQPAYIYVAQGNGTAHNRNRRGWGYTDDNLLILDFIAASTGERIGSVINFAAHPVKIGMDNRLIAADWCYYTRTRGEYHLDAPVIYHQGAEGDVSPNGCDGDDFEGAEVCGSAIADSAVSFLSNPTLVTGPLSCLTHEFRHVVTNPGFIVADKLGWLDYDFDDTPEGYFVDTQVSYWRIGDQVQGVSWPGECLTRIVLPVKDAMPGPFKMFLGLTGDSLGYFVPSDEWDVTGYEEKVSINKWVGDYTRDLMIDIIRNN